MSKKRRPQPQSLPESVPTSLMYRHSNVCKKGDYEPTRPGERTKQPKKSRENPDWIW